MEKLIPILITGAGHSGTGILYRMLALHPDLAWFSQFSQRGGSIPGRRRIPLHGQLDYLLRTRIKHEWWKTRRGWRQFLGPRPKEAHQVWGYIFPKDGSISREESVRRLRTILETEMKRSGRRFFIAKLPRLYRHLSPILEAYPNAKFVHIVRDGRAVVLSRRYKPRKFMRNHGEFHELEPGIEFWTDVIKRVNADVPRDNLYELRYEDFCTDVHAHLKNILEFIGLDPSRFPFDVCPAKLNPTNPKWFQHATPEEVAFLDQTLAAELKRYGYGPITAAGVPRAPSGTSI